jgi:hypothetical protein
MATTTPSSNRRIDVAGVVHRIWPSDTGGTQNVQTRCTYFEIRTTKDKLMLVRRPLI